MSEENVRVAKASYEALARKDYAGVLATYGSDCELRPGIPSEPWQGHQAAEKYFRTLDKRFAELRVEPAEFLASNDRVVVLGTVRGRARRVFAIPFAHVMSFRGGKIVEFVEYLEPSALFSNGPPSDLPPDGWPKLR